MTIWLTVFAVWCIACAIIFAFNYSAHRGDNDEDSNDTPSLDLRIRLERIRKEQDDAEGKPYRKAQKERARRATERYLDRIAMEIYLDDAGDR